MPSDANENDNTKFNHGVKNNNVPSSVQDHTQKNPVTEPRRVFPNNIRPLNSAVEDTAAPVTPTKDLPVFPPEEGPVSLRITRRDSTSITLAWDAPPGKLPTLYNLLMDRVSVYSGSQKVIHKLGLRRRNATCFKSLASS